VVAEQILSKLASCRIMLEGKAKVEASGERKRETKFRRIAVEELLVLPQSLKQVWNTA